MSDFSRPSLASVRYYPKGESNYMEVPRETPISLISGPSAYANPLQQRKLTMAPRQQVVKLRYFYLDQLRQSFFLRSWHPLTKELAAHSLAHKRCNLSLEGKDVAHLTLENL